MNVLVVVSPLSEWGGTIKRISMWMKYMPDKISVSILYGGNESKVVSKLLSDLSRKQDRVIRSSFLGRYSRIMVLPTTIVCLMNMFRSRPDIVISNFFWMDVAANLASSFYRRATGRRFVHAMHIAGDPMPPQWEKGWRRRLYYTMIHSAMKNADWIIVISSILGEQLREKYAIPDSKKFVVAHIGVAHADEAFCALELQPELTVFGVVSRFVREKNIDAVIRAMAVLRNEGLDACLEIWGEGEYKFALSSLIDELDLGDTVQINGWTEYPQETMQNIDCLVLMSDSEGTPRSILEAGSVGVPSIASNVGGIPDIILDGKTGWLLDPDDEKGLVGRMRSLIVDKQQIPQAGECARKFVSDEFSVERELATIISLVGS